MHTRNVVVITAVATATVDDDNDDDDEDEDGVRYTNKICHVFVVG